jgi:hypothetical protein
VPSIRIGCHVARDQRGSAADDNPKSDARGHGGDDRTSFRGEESRAQVTSSGRSRRFTTTMTSAASTFDATHPESKVRPRADPQIPSLCATKRGLPPRLADTSRPLSTNRSRIRL